MSPVKGAALIKFFGFPQWSSYSEQSAVHSVPILVKDIHVNSHPSRARDVLIAAWFVWITRSLAVARFLEKPLLTSGLVSREVVAWEAFLSCCLFPSLSTDLPSLQ